MKNQFQPALKGSIKYIKHKCLVYQIVPLPFIKQNLLAEIMVGPYQAVLIMN